MQKKNKNSVILYTIVDNNLAKQLANLSSEKNIPCFWCSWKPNFKFL